MGFDHCSGGVFTYVLFIFHLEKLGEMIQFVSDHIWFKWVG